MIFFRMLSFKIHVVKTYTINYISYFRILLDSQQQRKYTLNCINLIRIVRYLYMVEFSLNLQNLKNKFKYLMHIREENNFYI